MTRPRALGIASVALIVLGAVVYVAINRTSHNVPPSAPEAPHDTFVQTGYVTRNNPGQEQGLTYLVYEKPGAPALSVQLVFSATSTCVSDTASIPCDSVALESGTHAQVSGIETATGTVAVRQLRLLTGDTAMSVYVYGYSAARDLDAHGNPLCSRRGLVAVPATIPSTSAPIRATLDLLLSGNEMPPPEAVGGVTSEYPLPGVTLTNTSLANGVLTVTLADPQHKTSGGACRADILRYQLEATALQFPQVTQVTITPSDLFQP